jgi:hypothetical protein
MRVSGLRVARLQELRLRVALRQPLKLAARMP